ncbi:MAG: hypothetical protein IKN54_05635 [Lachnospiraceae bacterium]|nr:hypothetical protein [Lachnospiraceae bacterium]
MITRKKTKLLASSVATLVLVTSLSTINSSYDVTANHNVNPDTSTYESATTTAVPTANTPTLHVTLPKLHSPKIKLTKRRVYWKNLVNASGYHIFARKNKDSSFKKIKTIHNNQLFLSQLKKGNFYRLRVRAFKKINGHVYYSKKSNIVKFLTPVSLDNVSSNIAGNLTVNWRKGKVSGYTLQYATDSSFKNKVEKSYKGTDTTSSVFYEMNQNTTYYVRVRGYRSIGTKRYYSAWSKVKSVKIKDASDIIYGGFPDTKGFFKNTVFLGDSVMLGFRNYINRKPGGYLDGAKVFGIGSYSLIHATNPASPLHPLYKGKATSPEKLIQELDANKVFLFFGINDVCTAGGLEGAYSNYLTLINNIKKINPNVKIYIMSATYTLKGSKLDTEFHDRLHALNSRMRTYCSDNGYQFIDIASYLSDNEGYLKPEYCSDGFLHESYSAYEIWDKVLRNFAIQ